MKICLDITPLTQPTWTGVHMVTRDVTQQLIHDYPHDTWVLSAMIPRGEYERFARFWQNVDPSVIKKFMPLPARLFHFGLPRWQATGWPPIETFTGPIDHYHSFEWFHLPSRCPSSATIHDWSPMNHPEWYDGTNVATFIDRWNAICRSRATIVPISQFLQAEILSVHPDLQKRIRVIPNGIPMDCTVPTQTEITQTMTQLKLKPGFMLAIGTLAPRKNYATLFRAYAQYYRKASTPKPLVVVANLDLLATTEFRQTPGLRVIPQLPRSAIMALLSQAAALFFPSWYEGFGLPVLEAMHCGCPVVASAIPAMKEIGGQVISYVEPADEAGWTAEMSKLTTRDKNTGIREQQQAEKFHLDRIAAYYYELFTARVHP